MYIFFRMLFVLSFFLNVIVCDTLIMYSKKCYLINTFFHNVVKIFKFSIFKFIILINLYLIYLFIITINIYYLCEDS